MKLLIISCFVIISISSALACSCAQPKPPKQALEESEAVFSGRVVTIEEPGMLDQTEPLVVTFKVDSVWKGAVTNPQTVRTSPHSASCGFGFEDGEEYIVYANANPDSYLWTSICTRTRVLTDAKEDLRELGEGSSPRTIKESSGGLIKPAIIVGIVVVGLVLVVLLFLRRR